MRHRQLPRAAVQVASRRAPWSNRTALYLPVRDFTVEVSRDTLDRQFRSFYISQVLFIFYLVHDKWPRLAYNVLLFLTAHALSLKNRHAFSRAIKLATPPSTKGLPKKLLSLTLSKFLYCPPKTSVKSGKVLKLKKDPFFGIFQRKTVEMVVFNGKQNTWWQQFSKKQYLQVHLEESLQHLKRNSMALGTCFQLDIKSNRKRFYVTLP